MIIRFLPALLISLSAFSLAACEATQDELGLSRRSPDEFAVYQRAPLEMPPDYALRPPQPGQPRPQDPQMDEQARQTLLGGPPSSAVKGISAAEAHLLKQSQAGAADPTIRQTLDAETRAIAEEEKPTIKRLMGLGGADSQAPARVVDPAAEAARIKATRDSGQTVTATPSVAIDD